MGSSSTTTTTYYCCYVFSRHCLLSPRNFTVWVFDEVLTIHFSQRQPVTLERTYTRILHVYLHARRVGMQLFLFLAKGKGVEECRRKRGCKIAAGVRSLVYPLLASIIDKLDYLKHTLRCRKLKSHPPGGSRVGSFRGRARLLIYLLTTSGRICPCRLPTARHQSPIPPLPFPSPCPNYFFSPSSPTPSPSTHSVPSRNTRSSVSNLADIANRSSYYCS